MKPQLILIALILLATAAMAKPAPVVLSPTLDCVKNESDGTYSAWFGYDSLQNLTVAIGPNNKILPSPLDNKQPSNFSSGTHSDVFCLNWDGNGMVKWQLKSPSDSMQQATATTGSAACSGIMPSCMNTDPHVPEFGTVAALGLAIVGGLVVFVSRKH